ncbi:zinc finger and BTB domain-containing protein 16 [Carassius auratus]|uniref:Zinc finger and BTB domain-containing protein 16-like n=1 Tax=Carassius auratus TaxID=7957 RepID=A0A6P6QWG6_CARAU|nr:zinc finger and BTB domain-containing protein 16-like [Carassius auratus]XP_026137844.1 zinc finger and BTB domain-containing protein 16-like [Carassius auratus]XP_052433020.1 zinc finger and BTB domain-containing protein 16 [Carassius gibelio]XP_052433021.1 zinc finger and BTB domain-containing protein 16 [Carassius gibelio]
MIRIHNPHHVPFLHQTEQLRQAGTLCDTLLTVEGLSFKAHALILALASKRLKRQLTNQHSPGSGYCCIIDRVSSHTFKQILDYVYSESLEVPKDDLEELLRGAEYLEVESLVEQCQAQLRDPESPTKTDTKVKNSLQVDKAHKDTQLPKNSHNLDGDHLDCSLEEERYSTKRPVQDAQKKSCSPVSPVPPIFSRDTIISSSSPSPSPRLCWPPVSTSRSMLLNCREIMTFHSLRAYPYPTPMYPILHHSLQPQVSSSLMGYTGLIHPYHPLIHSSPLTQDRPFVPGLKGKNASISAALTGSMSDDQERKPKVQEEREICCRHCGKPALENPWRPMTGSSTSGSEEMALRCKFCGRGGRDRRSLRSLRRGVGGEKPYQCKQCSKRFSLKHQLDTHHRVHTGEKPFECRLCGQRSRDYSAMIKHLRTHGGATPYQCTMCLEFCSSLAAMQKHLKNHPTQDFPPDWSLSSTYLYTCHT